MSTLIFISLVLILIPILISGEGGIALWLLLISAFIALVVILMTIALYLFSNEAYSAAGKTWFGWWLVEHYFSYHIDCPDGCDSGEPARGRKDPPYFQMSYGSLDNIPDLVDSFVESPLPV